MGKTGQKGGTINGSCRRGFALDKLLIDVSGGKGGRGGRGGDGNNGKDGGDGAKKMIEDDH